ncbi:hypothetical protein INT45_012992 [Circinella minor]|uniref:Heterokaryon incompatibility domain-containing protein n=1 Tax=Circinella minor TaxID=1195481 RepID=A0A8H7RZ00_9FUNG|nr:hypothetical protein INT45_012992 [Circinella minor]
MYITYCRNQKTVDLEDKTDYRLSLTGGDYRPTWLMRVSDWKKVPGTEAVNGYHTISYCWEQSGEVVKNETDDEYSLVDNGKHCIVEGYKVYEDKIFQWAESSDEEDDQEADEEGDDGGDLQDDNKDDNQIVEKDDYQKYNDDNKKEYQEENHKDNGENDKEDTSKDDSNSDEEEETADYKEYVSWCEPVLETTTLRYVTYDELLQQVCKDFQVEYVWYDKICIDQSDPKAKSREIKQMHKIYRNARYTIAMIPEVSLYIPEDFEDEVYGSGHRAQDRVTNDIWFSFWFKRSWTLEEVMMARRILIVGINTNMFQHSLNTTDIPTTTDFLSTDLLDFGITKQNSGSVNQALAYAHFRTSTKPHDMIYALKNTFHYMFDDIEVSYKRNIKTVFNEFYRHIATEDLSILCFGSNLRLDGYVRANNTIDAYKLPSWTGVAGNHVTSRTIATAHPQLKYHIDDTMRMHITTKQYWKISITPYDHGCYALSKTSIEESRYYVNKIDIVNTDRADGNWNDMATVDKDTVLLDWLVNIQSTTSRYMTHYHQPQSCLLSQIRPLTLTEDCEECIILPILLVVHTPIIVPADDEVPNSIIENYKKDYCLPVFRECTKGTGRYRAIGIYYIGDGGQMGESTFQWNHFIKRDDIYTEDPKEIVNILFENHAHDVPKKFIIE